jgi:hypothetical protein
MAFTDDRQAVSVMVGRLVPRGSGESEETNSSVDEGLIVAAQDILVALGQDYGGETESGRIAFEDKSRHLAEALSRFLEIAKEGPESGEMGEYA